MVPFLSSTLEPSNPLEFSVGVCAIALLRTTVDHWWAWDLYSPSKDE